MMIILIKHQDLCTPCNSQCYLIILPIQVRAFLRVLCFCQYGPSKSPVEAKRLHHPSFGSIEIALTLLTIPFKSHTRPLGILLEYQ